MCAVRVKKALGLGLKAQCLSPLGAWGIIIALYLRLTINVYYFAVGPPLAKRPKSLQDGASPPRLWNGHVVRDY